MLILHTLLFCYLILFLGITKPLYNNSSKYPAIYPKREFRAVWVATLNNIDWPSRRGLPPEEQRREFIALLDTLKKYHFNAIIVQIRPTADAFYPSEKEPWSAFLTGTQGEPPYPYYDPLAFMIEEAHRRNIEFHAWFNPYRAISNLQQAAQVHPEHILHKQPHWFFDYNGKRYFNPGVPDVRHHIVSIIMEVARRYDIDGIHFDDYFYPYQVPKEVIQDQTTYQQYGKKQFTNIHDWRRHNVDLLIKMIHDSLQQYKPYVKFGISPIGVWRNASSDSLGSATRIWHASYDQLYADTRKWLQEGWIDYIAPQLYWSTRSKMGNYEVLVPWWHKNSFGRHVYVGHALYKVGGEDGGDPSWHQPTELPRQLSQLRQYHAIKGSIFFSAKHLYRNPLGILDSLRQYYYRYPALPPTMPWKDSLCPPAPLELTARRTASGIHLQWRAAPTHQQRQAAAYYVLYRFAADEPIDTERPECIRYIGKEQYFLDQEIPDMPVVYVVTACNRLHNESQNTTRLLVEPQIVYGSPPQLLHEEVHQRR